MGCVGAEGDTWGTGLPSTRSAYAGNGRQTVSFPSGTSTAVAGLLAEYLGDLESFDAEESRSVQSSNVTRAGPEIYVSVLHGQSGMVADIFDEKVIGFDGSRLIQPQQ